MRVNVAFCVNNTISLIVRIIIIAVTVIVAVVSGKRISWLQSVNQHGLFNQSTMYLSKLFNFSY